MTAVIVETFKIALLGFDERSSEMMRLIFQGPGKQCCTISPAQDASAAIINLDAVNGHAMWQEYRKHHPTSQVILMAMKEPEQHDAIYLRKPVRQDDLLMALRGLTHKRKPAGLEDGTTWCATPKQPLQQASTAVVASATLSESSYYEPQEYLQGELSNAMGFAQRKESAMALTVLSGSVSHEIILAPSLNRVIHHMDDAQLAQLCSTPLCLLNVSARRCSSQELTTLAHEIELQAVGEIPDAFFWKVGYHTSLGRLPAGTNTAPPIYVSRWPNYTRLYTVPHAMRITALLIERPRPMPLVAKVLGIGVAEVFSFYCAAHAIGVSGVSKREADLLVQHEPAPPRQHGLFGRLLNRLKDIARIDA